VERVMRTTVRGSRDVIGHPKSESHCDDVCGDDSAGHFGAATSDAGYSQFVWDAGNWRAN